MNPAALTLVYVTTLVAVTIAFDAAVYLHPTGGWHATISYLCLTRGKNYPLLVVATSMVLGHLFWPASAEGTTMRRAADWAGANFLVLVGIGLALSRLWAQPFPKPKGKEDEINPP